MWQLCISCNCLAWVAAASFASFKPLSKRLGGKDEGCFISPFFFISIPTIFWWDETNIDISILSMIMGQQKISRLSAYHGCLLALSGFFFFFWLQRGFELTHTHVFKLYLCLCPKCTIPHILQEKPEQLHFWLLLKHTLLMFIKFCWIPDPHSFDAGGGAENLPLFGWAQRGSRCRCEELRRSSTSSKWKSYDV